MVKITCTKFILFACIAKFIFVCVFTHMYISAHSWWSEDNLLEIVLSFHLHAGK